MVIDVPQVPKLFIDWEMVSNPCSKFQPLSKAPDSDAGSDVLVHSQNTDDLRERD